MKATEFKSKPGHSRIIIFNRIQIQKELKSINQGLKDFKEGRTHLHESD